jgi:hypothetical protein
MAGWDAQVPPTVVELAGGGTTELRLTYSVVVGFKTESRVM